jgi:serine/threonine protein kinase
MSPEQLRGDPLRVDARADVYSLGVVMYELLCHTRPFNADTLSALAFSILGGEVVPPHDIVPSVPPELERICLKAMARELSVRYASARDMALDLSTYLTTNQYDKSLGQDRAALWNTIRPLLGH